MNRIRGKDTTPEKAVRSLLHRLGYRFRLNVKIPAASVYDRRTVGNRKSGGRRPPLQEPTTSRRLSRRCGSGSAR
jgi:hypothetical protein